MIELDRVSVSVQGDTILDDVSLRVARGEHVVVGGPTASGKSSLLSAIAGFHPLDTGRITVDGEEVTPRSVRRLRRLVAMVDQEPVLSPGPARDALLAPFRFAANRALSPGEEAIGAALAAIGLDPAILGRDTNVLSGGEKQRLALSRALLLERPILLLDEVTSALDQETSAMLLAHVRSLPFTVLAVSHDAAWLAGFDRSYRIESGRLARR